MKTPRPIVVHGHATDTVMKQVPSPKADPTVTTARSRFHLVTALGISVARAESLLKDPSKS